MVRRDRQKTANMVQAVRKKNRRGDVLEAATGDNLFVKRERQLRAFRCPSWLGSVQSYLRADREAAALRSSNSIASACMRSRVTITSVRLGDSRRDIRLMVRAP